MPSFTGREQTFLDQTIPNNGFFPDLSVEEFQQLHRVPGHYADAAIIHQLNSAVMRVNSSLIEQQTLWELEGLTDLSDVDATDSGSRMTLYKDAVFYRAKASLLNDFQTFSRRDSSEEQAKEGHNIYQSLLADSRTAVNLLLGESPTVSAELL